MKILHKRWLLYLSSNNRILWGRADRAHLEAQLVYKRDEKRHLWRSASRASGLLSRRVPAERI